MNVWIMRHGEAGFNAGVDHQRSLTEYGKKTARSQGEWLGKRLANKEQQIDKIIVSPFLRAQQTFEEVLKGLQAVNFDQKFTNSIQEKVESWEGVTPYGTPNSVLDYIRVLRESGVKNVLIISHLPLVYELVSYFTQHQSKVHFYPAVIAEIDWTTDNGKLIISEKPE
ncbi:Phosphohistidine phosphatase sixA [Phocoenobacter uteri]|uniref:Phosphohistidine phosphatase sixA n=1 Tax=Phocoenobacter uteri TaxID=146806 RepID=A0A379C900_9PAST|nr:phosphohistidine phosphatase SixA [Phocoenobacter uteri]MDG6882027.1 phosphohistidine phosphatase SixA [Phocoenobacter uteri]SUB58176.1 Phosphohistidine phosphatase sixA [Phocoenobacter uteri]